MLISWRVVVTHSNVEQTDPEVRWRPREWVTYYLSSMRCDPEAGRAAGSNTVHTAVLIHQLLAYVLTAPPRREMKHPVKRAGWCFIRSGMLGGSRSKRVRAARTMVLSASRPPRGVRTRRTAERVRERSFKSERAPRESPSSRALTRSTTHPPGQDARRAPTSAYGQSRADRRCADAHHRDTPKASPVIRRS